jgi:hypothetical protein
MRVSAAGGAASPVTRLAPGDSAAGHRFAVFLPDGAHFLYAVSSVKADTAGIYAGSLGGGEPVRVLPDVAAVQYVPPAVAYPPAHAAGTGHLLFRRERALMAQAFDPRSLRVTGEILPLAENLLIETYRGMGMFAVSENGPLFYRSAATESRELVWLDRSGKRLGTAGKPGDYADIALSPDEKNLAVTVNNGDQSDIWLEDIARGVMSRFTALPGDVVNPVWSPDGGHLAFPLRPQSISEVDIYQKPAGGSGQEELLLHAGVNGNPTDWSADGKWIAYRHTGQNTANDIWLLPVSGDRKPVLYLQTPFNEENARFSPDGKWMAYQSDESGSFEVYVQAIPTNGTRYQISTGGGQLPQWRRDGKEIYYISGDRKLMAAPVKIGATVEPGAPQVLFPYTGGTYFSPTRDGQRFLVNVPAGGDTADSATLVTVMLNWQAGLKK